MCIRDSPTRVNEGIYNLFVTDANTNCTFTSSVMVLVAQPVTICALDTFPFPILPPIPYVGATTNFQFNITGLINTPFDISGVPTSLPEGYTGTIGLTITTIGDIGFTQAAFFGEDGSLLGSSGISAGNCDLNGSTVTIPITAAQYNAWAADGVISLMSGTNAAIDNFCSCLLYTSPSPRDRTRSRMPSSA